MNKEAARIFSRLTLPEKTVNVKLLGDSITHGVGGTGFVQSGEPIAAGFRRNPDGFCWAKLFSEYLVSRYDCRVTNNACTGTTIEFILDHFDELVSESDDIILCAIGTNNRHQYFANAPMHTRREHMEAFYNRILELAGKFAAIKKDVIFIANIPASKENEKDGPDYARLFHMNDVRDIYMKASVSCGFPLISLYDLFLDYCDRKNVPFISLLADGLHPSDEGHRVIFEIMKKELGVFSA